MRILGLTICFLLMAVTVQASVNDAPHNITNNISCSDCHSYSLWWQFSPSTNNPQQSYAQTTNTICMVCHGPTGAFIEEGTHSSDVMGTTTAESQWSRNCVDCHDPHFQAQIDWLATEPALSDQLYLVTGTMIAGTLNYDSIEKMTTFSYTSANTTQTTWFDPATWNRKTELGRGLILVASAEDKSNSFEVNGATGNNLTVGMADGNGTMTVQGEISSALNGSSFALIYGQLIKKEVNNRTVKFFGPNAVKYAFIDKSGGDPPEGLCQACHTQTKYYVISGSGQDHYTAPCMDCHSHKIGFGHGSGSSGGTGIGSSGCGTSGCHDDGKHSEHLGLLIECTSCHDLANMRDQSNNILFAYGKKLAETNVCDTCHQDATGTPTTGFKAGWSTPSFDLDCSGCHAVAPSTGSHPTHLSFTDCESCHDGTVAGTTAPAQHIDQNVDVYDIDPADLGYPVDKVIGSTYSSCANMYCHSNGTSVETGTIGSYTSATWGSGSLACNSCHGFGPDYPNGSPKANSHQAHGTSCQLCHAATTTTGTSITNQANHANGVYDLLAGDGVSFSYSAGTCDNISCHQGANAVWGSGPLACDSCHGFGPGYPNGSPKANSHQAHGTSCQLCHAATTTTGTSITNPANHANGVYDLLAGDGVSFSYSAGTCDNISCHQGANAVWGSITLSFDCDSCHSYPPEPGDGKDINALYDGGKGVHITSGDSTGSLGRGGHIIYPNGLNPTADIYGDSTTGYNECAKCHMNGVHGNGEIDMKIMETPWSTPTGTGDYVRPYGFGLGSPEYNGVPGENTTPKTCSNIICHQGDTPRWSCARGE